MKSVRRVVPARGNRHLRHGVTMTEALVLVDRAQVDRGLVRRGKVAHRAKVGLVALAIVHPVVRFVVPAVQEWVLA